MTRFFFLMCLLLLMPLNATAADCPVRSGTEKLKIIAEAKSCQEAVDLFKLCAIGAKFDAQLAQPVIAGCEKRFLTKLSPEKRKSYAAAIQKCNAQFAHRQGTMYQSMGASCRVNVTYKYSKLH